MKLKSSECVIRMHILDMSVNLKIGQYKLIQKKSKEQKMFEINEWNWENNLMVIVTERGERGKYYIFFMK